MSNHDFTFCRYNSETNRWDPIEDNNYWAPEINEWLNTNFNFNCSYNEFYRCLELKYLCGRRLSYLGRIVLTIPLILLSIILWILSIFTVKE